MGSFWFAIGRMLVIAPAVMCDSILIHFRAGKCYNKEKFSDGNQ